MTKAIHFISRREGVSFHGMSRWEEEQHGYQSCCWLLSDDDAAALIGGWVYFHTAKSEPSGFGGQIMGFTSGEGDMADRKIILFRADKNGRGKAWRGADHGMAYTSGVIDADLRHEMESVS